MEEESERKKIEEKNQYNNLLKAVNNLDYSFVTNFVNSDKFKYNQYCVNKIKNYSANTYGEYHLVSNKKCFILNLDYGCSICCDISKPVYISSDINGKILIFDKLYYKSYAKNSQVRYMELD